MEKTAPISGYKPEQRNVPIHLEAETVRECPITDVDTRHETYSALLSMLSLSQDHKQKLLARGFTEQEVEIHM